MPPRLALVCLLAAPLSCSHPDATSTAPEAPRVPIALTFDDLPYQTRRGGVPLEGEAAIWADTTERLLAALRDGGAPATVFVNCANLAEDDALVARWRTAGHAIGNHTAHHTSAVAGPLEEWIADVRACDGLWAEGSTEPRWFRFPYLWRGETVEQRDAIAAALAGAGYRTVPVTVDSHDWAYEFARRRNPDPASRAELVQMLVANTADAVDEARRISREKLGREAAQVLLLHVNALTADALPAILDGLERDGLTVAPVEQVMADPLYSQPDAWAGRGARWWLARTDPITRPDGTAWYSDREANVTAALEARFGPPR